MLAQTDWAGGSSVGRLFLAVLVPIEALSCSGESSQGQRVSQCWLLEESVQEAGANLGVRIEVACTTRGAHSYCDG